MTHIFLLHKVLTIFLLIIIALAVFTAFKWKTWFHNPEEEAYAVADKPAWIMLTFGNGMENSRYVSWICGDESYESNLELVNANKGDTTVLEANGEIFESRAGKAAYYMVRLNDLDPDTHYSYRVSTNGRTSDWYSFQTYPYERNRFAFVYVGDVQDTINGASNTISANYSKGIMSELAKQSGEKGYIYVDWNVTSGDGITALPPSSAKS